MLWPLKLGCIRAGGDGEPSSEGHAVFLSDPADTSRVSPRGLCPMSHVA